MASERPSDGTSNGGVRLSISHPSEAHPNAVGRPDDLLCGHPNGSTLVWPSLLAMSINTSLSLLCERPTILEVVRFKFG